jgi:nitroimidazol reductase NimA-like FMN-containing flavoprotein (pyridoxamine 5'-phosphate oxidase superfamily)
MGVSKQAGRFLPGMRECTVSQHAKPLLEELDPRECRRLISPGGIGRIAYLGRYDLTVLPVNYRWVDGAVLFRVARDSVTGKDLRTGIRNADFKVAFEIDHLDKKTKEGWSVLIQGPAHHIDSAEEQTALMAAGVHPWAGEDQDHFIRITPTRVTGRRVRQPI